MPESAGRCGEPMGRPAIDRLDAGMPPTGYLIFFGLLGGQSKGASFFSKVDGGV
jgi:hypothetical protein